MRDTFSHFDLSAMPKPDVYKLLASVIMPRPIAWVVSRDDAGSVNAAPFSFFNILSADPPLIAISFSAPSDREGTDTFANIRQHPDFVVNLVPEELAPEMNITATNAPRGTDETKLAGLDLTPSSLIEVPRIAASPVGLECRLFQTIDPGGSSIIVLAHVLYAHVRTEAFASLERLYIDPHKLRLIGRMHGSGGYCRTTDIFTIDRKSWPLDE
jgi:flavin reductase (DIM6/NTAB) family NADH-FMN oxidoreductase RutF